jgi:hypothetical protein
MIHPLRLFALSATLLLLVRPLPALEGGMASTSRDWAPARQLPVAPVSTAERAAEVQARNKAIAADIARIRARLGRTPDTAKLQKYHARLKAIHAAYGWVPELGMVWGRRDIQGILEDQGKVPEGLLRAFVQLRDDLAARGIDLVIVPFPPTPHIQGHLVADGIRADQDYTPGWSRMLLQMLEAGLEVIDPLDEFRAEANNPILINWVNDFHTASRGRQIAAGLVAERLRRYNFIRSLPPAGPDWSFTTATRDHDEFTGRIATVNGMVENLRKKGGATVPAGRVVVGETPREWNLLVADAPAGMREALEKRSFQYLELNRPRLKPELARNDLVLIGDSQLHSAVLGAGLPDFYMAAMGGFFRWGSKSWSGFSPPDIFREVVPDDSIQPRVVVLSSLAKYFWEDKCSPRPLPPLAGAGSAGQAAAALPSGPFDAQVRITAVSKQRDPRMLDYNEALAHAAGVIVGGPHDGREIGVRFWTMRDRQLIAAAGAVQPGQTLKLTLQPWSQAIAADAAIGQHMIYNDTPQESDLSIPVFWVSGGPLSPGVLLRR